MGKSLGSGAKPGPVIVAKPRESSGADGGNAGGGSSIDRAIFVPGKPGTVKAPR